MAEANDTMAAMEREYHHRGRTSQVPIYLKKQLRFFFFESDWKVLVMAAIIAALVSLVIRNKIFVNMEGTLIGAFALTCVAIWNGCFNSIQSVCRERAIIKREHRAGMHISAYLFSHMVYQLLLCLLQTVVSMYVLYAMNIGIPAKGFMTPWMVVDLGITMLLISYASDMLSLLISCIARTTTGAMTVMPFVLIFQLIFSGGFIPIPQWIQPVSNFTISTYGMRAIAAQCDYNNLSMDSVWKTVSGMKDSEIEATVTLGELAGLMDSDLVAKYREEEVIHTITADQALEYLNIPIEGAEGSDVVIIKPVSLGQVLDLIKSDPHLEEHKDASFTLKTTLGELMNVLGEEKVKEFIREKTAASSYNPLYEQTSENIISNWLKLCFHMLIYAVVATLLLELIDRDKR